MALSRGHIILYREAGNGDVLGSLWVSQTQVVCVRKRQLCGLVSMNVNNRTQCSQDQKPQAFFVFRANSATAPRNSMRTKTLFSKEGKFWSKIRPKWPNPRGSYSKPMGS